MGHETYNGAYWRWRNKLLSICGLNCYLNSTRKYTVFMNYLEIYLGGKLAVSVPYLTKYIKTKFLLIIPIIFILTPTS